MGGSVLCSASLFSLFYSRWWRWWRWCRAGPCSRQIGILPPTYLPPPITLPHHPTSSFISLYFCLPSPSSSPHAFTLPTSPHSSISLPPPPFVTNSPPPPAPVSTRSRCMVFILHPSEEVRSPPPLRHKAL